MQANDEFPVDVRHLTLEPIEKKHALLLFDLLQSPELYTYIPHTPPKSIAALEQRYLTWSQRRSPDGRERWLNYAVRNSTKGIYLGTVQATIEATGKTYVAYETFPAHWRQGIGRCAVNTLLRLLFKTEGVRAATAFVDTRNKASYLLLESLGFERIGYIEAADEFKGAVSNEYVYEISIDRWLQMEKTAK